MSSRLPARSPAAATTATAAVAPPASAAATTAATTIAVPSTAAAGWFRTRLVHVHRATVHLGSVQLRNRRLSLTAVGHFDESKSTRLSRVPVGHDVDPLDVAVLCK